MTNWKELIITTIAAETFPLTDCTLLMPRIGDNEFGEPLALRLSDNETIISLWDERTAPVLEDQDGKIVQRNDIDWTGHAEPTTPSMSDF